MSDPLYSEALNLLAVKIAEDDSSLGPEFPYVTGAEGAWRTLPAELSAGYDGENWSHGNWFCGFHVGLLLAAYLWTGDGGLLERARSRMERVALRADDASTHDIGFIFESSAIPMYRVTGERAFADIALKAAGRLRARTVWTPKGAYVSSWGPLTDPRGRRSSAIDTMANLPLLYWAADFAADDSFRVCAEAHARMTAAAFVRPDNTTFHAVEYDTQTGERARGFTFQGHADTSCWSRGQAWAIYGFAATALATGAREYRDLAARLFDVFIARSPLDQVPPWDFDDPAGERAPRDSSAAAVVASAALDLAAIADSDAEADRWRSHARTLLTTLCTHCLALEGTHRGLLKHGCYSMPHGEGTDSAVAFGDYFFVEALSKIMMPGRFTEARNTATSAAS